MRKALRIAWRTLCAIAGAAIGAGLLGFWMHSWTLAAIGAVIGIPLGWLFGRFIPPLDLLAELD